MRVCAVIALIALLGTPPIAQNRYKDANAGGSLRVALSQQPLGPNGPSKGPDTMLNGGIMKTLSDMGATIRVDKAQLTALEETEYGGWKKLGLSLGHFADIVAKNER